MTEIPLGYEMKNKDMKLGQNQLLVLKHTLLNHNCSDFESLLAWSDVLGKKINVSKA